MRPGLICSRRHCRELCSAALILVAALVLAATNSGHANAEVAANWVVVTEIVDGDTVRLADGRQVRLVGIQAPKLPLGRRNFKTWPLGEESKSVLSGLVLQKSVRLAFGGRRIDRHGRLLAHLHGKGNQWIQGEMLSRGMARVYSFPDNRTRVAAMMALERAARVARRGIWAHPFYRVRDADRVRSDKGTFQLVEGRVLDVATVKGRTYMNFGPDWRRDFMISIGRRHRKAFRGRWPALDILEGRLVRVRGWLIWRNGPMIEATHPEQIEVLE